MNRSSNRAVVACSFRAFALWAPLCSSLACGSSASPSDDSSGGPFGGSSFGGASNIPPGGISNSNGTSSGGGSSGAPGGLSGGGASNGGPSGGGSSFGGFSGSFGGAVASQGGSFGSFGGGVNPSGAGGGGGATPAGPFVPPADGNPFAGAEFYVNPDYTAEIQSSIDSDSADAALLGKVKAYPTAIWLDRIAKVPDVERHLAGALADEQRDGKPVVTVFVVYDLPNRDCAAKASNGELAVADGGLQKYETQFIDPIRAAFANHPSQRIVAILEPDSLPNIATNLSQPQCAASEQAYRDGVAYAIKTLAADNVFLYIDAAHSGWLGWPNNQTSAATIFKQVIDAAGGPQLVRGFATNTANYSVLHETTELFDYQGNPCHDELTFATQFGQALTNAGLPGKKFLIDTSRNGRGGIRHAWGNWCNVTGAGFGERPQANPTTGVDAYFWVKPPGESDGTSDSSATRYDSFCGNEDAAKPAPEAGSWFSSYFISVAKNANPPL